MSAENALLFIDANKYLDLYRTDKGRKLLAPLSEQASYIFITQQVIDEVNRNRVGVAAEFLRAKSQGLKLHSINVPDHLSGSLDGNNEEILNKMRSISRSVSSMNTEIDTHTNEIMTQIAESKDEVSKALIPIFSKSVRATEEEIKRARERREIGNPPGKKNNPLGDEISWEQILSHFKGKKNLWIISRDGDYGTAFGEKLFLNGFLKSELAKISDDPNVYIFQDLVEGLTHFVETTKVEAKVKLTPEEIAEIETEEKSLPPVDTPLYPSSSPQSFTSTVDVQRVLDAMQPSAQIQRALDAMRPSIDIQKVLDTMKPSFDIQRALDAMKPSVEVQRVLDAMKPSIDIQSALNAMQSSPEIQRALDALKRSAKENPSGEDV